MRRLRFIAAAAFALLHVVPLSAREWSDASGKHRIEAKLVTVKADKAYLEKSDGNVVGVPLSVLSKQDLQYLISLPECRDYFKEHPIPGLQPVAASASAPADAPGQTPPQTLAPVSSPAAPRDKPEPLKVSPIHVEDESKVGEIRRFGDLRWGVKSLAFSPDGRFLAAGKMDEALLLFDVDKSQKVAFLDHLEGLGQVTCVAFAPDGKKLLAGGYSGRIQVWDVGPDGALSEANRFVGHSGQIKTITVSKDGTRVLSGGRDKVARCWTLADASEQFAVDGFSRDLGATFITRGGKQGLACDGQTLALIDMREGKAIQTMKLDMSVGRSIAIAPDGSRVIAGDLRTLQGWQITSGQGCPVLEDHDLQWFATFLPNSKYLLSGGSGKVNLWDVAAGRKIYEFDVAGGGYIQTIAASPDNRHFAAIPSSAGQDIQVFRMPAQIAQ
jgi:WD40 repeat protein